MYYGKINIRMKTPPTLTDSHPPRLFPTILSGFNTVANNISLILLPVFVDLILWLGPKLKLETLLLPSVSNLTTSLLKLGSADIQDTIKSSQQMWTQILSQFNLGIAVRTFPVGVPSLVAREMIVDSPLGKMWQYQAPTLGVALLVFLALVILGFFLGSIYFNSLARYTAKPVEKLNFKKLMFQYGESIVMALILLVIILILAIPILLVLSAISLISAGLADFVILMALFAMLWLILPLIFSPHGVYVINQKAFPSMMLSIRMVRFFLPGTGMFIVTAALISEGLNMVWTLPEATSWLTLIGIAGHAFVVTALVAASFIYYREGLRWMQDTIQRMSAPMSKPENGGPFGSI